MRMMQPVLAALLLFGAAQPNDAPENDAAEILKTAGVKGGLVVHLGCGDGKLTAALRAGDAFVVHGLDSDPAGVDAARRHVRSLGLYGPVTIDPWDGTRLPHTDNLVNLIVSASPPPLLARGEIMRALAPGGVLCSKTEEGWTRTVKPVPDDIDDWTHYLHDASNNAVADDAVVGPPRHYQWIADPKWARSHDHLSTTSALVSSEGRLFTIIDEGPTSSVALPARWSLIARDAFSGILLWKRPIDSWEGHLRDFRTGPVDLARRLVAVGNRLFVTPGYGTPVVMLDGATGEEIMKLPDTENALEIIHHRETLVVVAGDRPPDNADNAAVPNDPEKVWLWWAIQAENPPKKRIIALDAKTGNPLWKKEDETTLRLMPTALAAAGDRLFLQTPGNLVALGLRDGKEIWRTPRPVNPVRPTWSAPTIVVHDGVVLSADRDANAAHPGADPAVKEQWIVDAKGGSAPPGKMIAFSAENGKRLWEAPCREVYNAPVDILVVDGLVWSGNLVSRKDPGITQALDLHTGEVKRTRTKDHEHFQIAMSHHRCYRNKATSRYLVLGRDGTEYIDVKTGKGTGNQWVRGACQYGVMPCNGLTYLPPHSCACHIESKLDSFLALAPERPAAPAAENGPRLVKGPACGKVETADADPSDWPTYRHDAARSGVASSSLPKDPVTAWETDLPEGPLSAPVIVGDRLFVSCIEANLICALDATNGKRIWNHTPGGRVDSPPTFHAGLLLFGSNDGWVYALRASDGELAWKFRAAPEERRIICRERLESPWPVHGSVLIIDGMVQAVAGRTPHLDGGMTLLRLDAATGTPVSETPVTGNALPDILSSDGSSVFLRHLRFDLEGTAKKGPVPHLFSPAGFLDGNWWHRTYWMVGIRMASSWGAWPVSGQNFPAGRIISRRGNEVFGYGRLNQYHRDGTHVGMGTRKYLLYASRWAPGEKTEKGGFRPQEIQWSTRIGILARSMVLGKDALCVAGPPDFFKPSPEEIKHPYHIASKEALQEQEAALAGERGASLLIVSTKDGSRTGEIKLSAMPAWDGMAAARGKLYLTTTTGKVICLKERP